MAHTRYVILGLGLAVSLWIGLSDLLSGLGVAGLAGLGFWNSKSTGLDTGALHEKIAETTDVVPNEAVAIAETDVTEPKECLDFSPLFSALEDGDFTFRLSESFDEWQESGNAALLHLHNAIDECLSMADLMAMGDLSTQSVGSYRGNLDKLQKSMNDVQSGLKSMIEEATTTGLEVSSQSQQMRQSADRLLSDVFAQNDSISQVSDAVITMDESVGSIAKSLEKSARAAKQSLTTVKDSGRANIDAEEALEVMTRDAAAIGEMLETIESIAQQTNLLAINASVEAARAGEAGQGFAVVSAEVKQLAQRSSTAAGQIREIVERNAQSVNTCSSRISVCTNLIADIGAHVNDINGIGMEIFAACDNQKEVLAEVRRSVDILKQKSDETTKVMSDTKENAEALGIVAENLNHSLSSFLLQDDLMVDEICIRSNDISKRLEALIDSGKISMEDLFSREYRKIEGTNPAQFETDFNRVADQVLPDILESALDISEGVIFSAAVNVDGFLPTHNKAFSKPPKPGDSDWNAANSRNRRFFNDRVGLAAGRSELPYLIQSYRRDMGAGNFVTMKDISAPIVVKGRHWGGLRIGYKPLKETASEFKKAA